MDFLKIGETPVPVQYPSGVTRDEPLEIGDRGRAFAGNLLTSIRGTKDKWSLRTPWMDREDADEIIELLTDSPPLSCSGDLFGGDTVSCVARLLGEDHVGRRVSVRFELEEE